MMIYYRFQWNILYSVNQWWILWWFHSNDNLCYTDLNLNFWYWFESKLFRILLYFLVHIFHIWMRRMYYKIWWWIYLLFITYSIFCIIIIWFIIVIFILIQMDLLLFIHSSMNSYFKPLYTKKISDFIYK